MPDTIEDTGTIELVSAFIDQHRLLPAAGIVLVAVSGGADSLCLLHLLHRLCGEGRRYPDVRLHAAHLDHQLRSDQSARDAAAVAAIVEQWGIPITTGRRDVPALARAERRSIEDAARLARYRFLRDAARQLAQEHRNARVQRPEVVIAVAHHADDQVETLLLHWLRGSGLPGMVGMQPRQRNIIRPLLGITHAQTVEYCQQHGIIPIEDASNTDLTYTRNRVRHQLLPLLESINPGFRAALLRNATVVAGDLDYIEKQVDAYWPQVVIPSLDEEDDTTQSGITLHMPSLLALPVNMQRHLLRRAAERLCGGQSPLELRHYAMIEELLHLPPDRRPREMHLPHGLRLVRVYQTAVIYSVDEVRSIATSNLAQPIAAKPAAQQDTLKPIPTTIPAEGEIAPVEMRLSIPGEVMMPGMGWAARAELLPDDMIKQVRDALRREDWQLVWQLLPSSRYIVYVDAASAGKELIVRTRLPGDRMRPLGMVGKKKVQDILVDAHIPRSERDTIPLFFTTSGTKEGPCVWLAGVCLDQRARLTGKTSAIVRLSLIPV